MDAKMVYDTVHVTVIDTIHRVIADSVTLDALKNSQVFYNDAYGQLIAISGLLLAVIVLATAVLGYINQRHTKSVLEDAKKQSEALLASLQKEVTEKFKKDAIAFVNTQLLIATQLENNDPKNPIREAFLHYYLALMKYPDFSEVDDRYNLDEIIDGIAYHWKSIDINSDGSHLAIVLLTNIQEKSSNNGDKKTYQKVSKIITDIKHDIEQNQSHIVQNWPSL